VLIVLGCLLFPEVVARHYGFRNFVITDMVMLWQERFHDVLRSSKRSVTTSLRSFNKEIDFELLITSSDQQL
jgi:hypothetical protein